MAEHWIRYVHESRVEDYLHLGWLIVAPLYLGDYNVWIMEHLCCCLSYEKPPEPIKGVKK